MEKTGPALTLPTVHLNGTSYSGLLNPLDRAAEALGKALESVAECAPHGRDYYPQGDDAFSKARAEHLGRVARIQSVLDEIKASARHVRRSERGK